MKSADTFHAVAEPPLTLTDARYAWRTVTKPPLTRARDVRPSPQNSGVTSFSDVVQNMAMMMSMMHLNDQAIVVSLVLSFVCTKKDAQYNQACKVSK